MWYTSAFNKIIGIGGGILPPLAKTNNKIATEPEAEQLLNKATMESESPRPPEFTPLDKKLDTLRTNGFLGFPMSQMIGRNTPAAILDQHSSGPDGIDGPKGGYENYRMQQPGAGVSV
jgi:hypothetical protein